MSRYYYIAEFARDENDKPKKPNLLKNVGVYGGAAGAGTAALGYGGKKLLDSPMGTSTKMRAANLYQKGLDSGAGKAMQKGAGKVRSAASKAKGAVSGTLSKIKIPGLAKAAGVAGLAGAGLGYMKYRGDKKKYDSDIKERAKSRITKLKEKLFKK